jgi:phage shock protein A
MDKPRYDFEAEIAESIQERAKLVADNDRLQRKVNEFQQQVAQLEVRASPGWTRTT